MRLGTARAIHRSPVRANFGPRTAERDPSALRAIAVHGETCLGVYGSRARPGGVCGGDPAGLAA
jgi:hypothetical protein